MKNQAISPDRQTAVPGRFARHLLDLATHRLARAARYAADRLGATDPAIDAPGQACSKESTAKSTAAASSPSRNAFLATPNRPSAGLLGDAIQRCRFGFGAVVAFSLAINLLMLTGPLYMLQVYDRVLSSGSYETLLYLTLIAAFALATVGGLEIARSRVMLRLGCWLERWLGPEVLSCALKASLGQKAQTIHTVDDVTAIRAFMTGPAVFPFLDAPWTPIFLAVIFLLHPLLGWIALAGACLLFGMALVNEWLTRKPSLRAGEATARALDEARAAARNIDVIEAMGMMPNVAARWAGQIEHALTDQARAGRLGGLIGTASKFIRQLLQIGMLGTGAYLVLGDQLSGGGMIAGSILLARALAPVEQSIMSWRSLIKARSAYRRLEQLLGMEDHLTASHPLPAPKGKIALENVSFAHPGAKEPQLRSISFELVPGEALGLIGPTAAGKSTLARLIIGNLKPQLGHARLDGADVWAWEAADRGQYVGYLPQDIELFSGSIRDNIARLGSQDSEAVYTAAKLAGVHEEILGLPNGYETQIGPAGATLSGGQRQRIGLARAVYGEPKLVVLDEPNSNLDALGERALFETLGALRACGTTIVIIAHRPAVLAGVDKILMLRDGAIEAFGPRDAVLAQLTGGKARPSGGNGAIQPALTTQFEMLETEPVKPSRKAKTSSSRTKRGKAKARSKRTGKAEARA